MKSHGGDWKFIVRPARLMACSPHSPAQVGRVKTSNVFSAPSAASSRSFCLQAQQKSG